MNELVENIKNIAKKKKGWNLKKTAIEAGIGENSIYRWKTQVPNMTSLDKVANVLGVSVDELKGNTNKNEKIFSDYDLEDMLDHAHSFDGKPMNDHDRDIIKGYLQGYFQNK